MMKKITLALVAMSSFASLADTVNVYSFRQDFLIKPILAEFTKETGIETKVVFAKKGLIERIKREGKYSPADVVLTSDFSKLLQLKDQGLTQAITDKNALNAVPAKFVDSDGHWLALTKRVRNIYASKANVANPEQLTYEKLAAPEFAGKICTRSGKHPYNLGLIASMISHKGEAETEKWLKAVKANLARKPQGNDRAQVKAIKEGLCDVSLGNSYYYGKMLTNKDQKAWADAVYLVHPNQNDRGAHINVSGAAVAKFAPHKENAAKLIAFLASEKAQQAYADLNFEYPVNPNVKPTEMVASWGEFKEDALSLAEVAKYRKAALKLVDKVKFDL